MQNQIEDVVQKSTQMWKLIYGFTTIKEGEEDPFEGRNNEEEEKEKEEVKVEKTQQGEEAIVEKQQPE